MYKLIISETLLNRVIYHCKTVYPNEACGILAGKDGLAEKVYEITNVEDSSVSYLMDPKEQFQVMKEIRGEGNKMIAIYHSHPHSPAYPSGKDVGLAFYPDAVYVIVGLIKTETPEIRAFEIVEGNVREIWIEAKS